MVENYDLMAAVAYMRDGRLSWSEWMRSFRQVEECAWFAADDPIPFALVCAGFPLKLGRTGLTSLVRNARTTDR
jgi:hypothetical protein